MNQCFIPLESVMMRSLAGAVGALALAFAASGQATLSPLVIKTIAEVQTKTLEQGREVPKLTPAKRVVPGDQVIYTLEVRNTGATAVVAPTVTNPVPAHMLYVADSAAGPGAEVTYSVDGGRSFDRPENLKVLGTDGHSRRALAKDYTHIRWQLKKTLKSNSVAYTRFRAVVK